MNQVQDLLKTAALVLREQESENRTLREKIAEYEKEKRAASLISRMEQRGYAVEGRTFNEKVASLMQHPRGLDAIETAVEFSAPHGNGFRLDDEAGNGTNPRAVFENAILGGN